MTYRLDDLRGRVSYAHWQWRERRLKLGLSIKQVARRLGWASDYYSRLETGSQVMREGTERKLARFYDAAEKRCPVCGRS